MPHVGQKSAGYADALEAHAWQEAGNGPHDDWVTEGGTKNHQQVAASRKKIVSYIPADFMNDREQGIQNRDPFVGWDEYFETKAPSKDASYLPRERAPCPSICSGFGRPRGVASED